jgi:DNA-nicking Smr family endonuclease
MSRRRQLSDEDRALWTGFARSIKPLRQSGNAAPRPAKAAAAVTAPAAPSGEAVKPPRKPRSPVPRTPPPAKPPPLEPLGRRLKQRVARGRNPIEARIDLHGMTQMEAHAALLRFLQRAQADGARIALVVTGKGSGGCGAAGEPGVLRRQVPLWLALPEFRPLIVGFEDAHSSHGGQGALYLRLRRGQ